MHPHLEMLLQIQDLKSQRRELNEHARTIEETEFSIDVDAAVAQLDDRIEELKRDLPAGIRTRVERFAAGSGRAVVPVINGICFGCFTAIPTAALSELRNDSINHCDHCGRFLYVVTDSPSHTT